GRRRIFSIGLGVYGTGSLITALSPSIGVLLFGWSFVEGIGAVLVIPAIAALTATNYSGRERALAFGLLGGIAGAGVAAGPLIGGFRSEEHTSELQSLRHLVCRLLLEKKKKVRKAAMVLGELAWPRWSAD